MVLDIPENKKIVCYKQTVYVSIDNAIKKAKEELYSKYPLKVDISDDEALEYFLDKYDAEIIEI